MKVMVGIWDHLSRVALLLLFVAGLIGVFFWYLPLIQHNQRFRQKIMALDEEVAREEQRQKDFKDQNYALQHDPVAVERAAREVLGYAAPGEIILKFENSRARRAESPGLVAP